eukprot:m.94685 g.94685  ORF g.94685 m.94685 type:complete len:943 (+) comp8578_c0_seq1:80-2908(+)
MEVAVSSLWGDAPGICPRALAWVTPTAALPWKLGMCGTLVCGSHACFISLLPGPPPGAQCVWAAEGDEACDTAPRLHLSLLAAESLQLQRATLSRTLATITIETARRTSFPIATRVLVAPSAVAITVDPGPASTCMRRAPQGAALRAALLGAVVHTGCFIGTVCRNRPEALRVVSVDYEGLVPNPRGPSSGIDVTDTARQLSGLSIAGGEPETLSAAPAPSETPAEHPATAANLAEHAATAAADALAGLALGPSSPPLPAPSHPGVQRPAPVPSASAAPATPAGARFSHRFSFSSPVPASPSTPVPPSSSAGATPGARFSHRSALNTPWSPTTPSAGVSPVPATPLSPVSRPAAAAALPDVALVGEETVIEVAPRDTAAALLAVSPAPWAAAIAKSMPDHAVTAATLCNAVCASWACRLLPDRSRKGVPPGLPAQHPYAALVYGPSGCGKTLLLESMRTSSVAPAVLVQCADIFADNDPCDRLRQVFTAALSSSGPQLLLLDAIDSLCGGATRGVSDHPFERGLFAQLCASLAECRAAAHVFVLATASDNRLPEDLLHLGLDVIQVHLGPPTPHGRGLLLRHFLSAMPIAQALLASPELAQIAGGLHGYSGADLVLLCRDAALLAIKRTVPDSPAPKMLLDDLQAAAASIRPALLGELSSPASYPDLSELAGIDDIIAHLRTTLLLPLTRPEIFRRLNVPAPRGVLLHGPPGTGKTTLALAFAKACGVNVVIVRATDVRSKVVGHAESVLARAFMAAQASQPCVMLLDQIEGLASRRGGLAGGDTSSDRLLSCLLALMDGTGLQRQHGGHVGHLLETETSSTLSHSTSLDGVTIMATTNSLSLVDQAILRPGRLDQIVEIPLPGPESRHAIFEKCLATPAARHLLLDESLVDDLVARTRGCSGADIDNLCREAAIRALRADRDTMLVAASDLLACLPIRMHS